MKFFIQLVVASSFFLTACSPSKQVDLVSIKSSAEVCQQVNNLIDQHQYDFKELKGKLTVSKRIDIWQAKIHLVGPDCQVWRWANGKQAYMCSQVVPDEQIAIEKYNKAVTFSKQCLAKAYQSETIDREHGRSYRTIFSKAGSETVASIHRIKSQGVFKSQWNIYYFIGDRDQSL